MARRLRGALEPLPAGRPQLCLRKRLTDKFDPRGPFIEPSDYRESPA